MHPVHRNAWAVLLVATLGCQAPPPSAPAAAPAAPAAKSAAAPTAAATAAPTSGPAAAAPTTGGMPSPLSPQVTVRVGTLSTVSDAGLYIGLERGYYRELGLNLEIETIPLPDTVGQLVASNHLDVGGYGVNTNPFMAATRGISVKIVADKGSMRPGFGYNPVITRRDLYESGQVRTAADLRGRKIARLGQCDSHDPFFQRLLGSAGLTYDDVEFVLLSFPDMNPALANGAIDAAVQIEPLATLALERGFASLIVTGDEVYPNQQLAALYFAAEFAARTEVAQRFMVAYVRALRDYNVAFVKNSGRAEIVQILAKHTTVKDVSLYDRFIPAGLDPNGRPNLEGIRNDVALLQRMGCIPSDVPDLVGRVVDESFVNYAVSVLGPYQP